MGSTSNKLSLMQKMVILETNNVPVWWCIYESLGLNVLTLMEYEIQMHKGVFVLSFKGETYHMIKFRVFYNIRCDATYYSVYISNYPCHWTTVKLLNDIVELPGTWVPCRIINLIPICRNSAKFKQLFGSSDKATFSTTYLIFMVIPVTAEGPGYSDNEIFLGRGMTKFKGKTLAIHVVAMFCVWQHVFFV